MIVNFQDRCLYIMCIYKIKHFCFFNRFISMISLVCAYLIKNQKDSSKASSGVFFSFFSFFMRFRLAWLGMLNSLYYQANFFVHDIISALGLHC